MTLGSNLTRFRASPEVPRLAVALLATAAVMLFGAGSWQLRESMPAMGGEKSLNGQVETDDASNLPPFAGSTNAAGQEATQGQRAVTTAVQVADDAAKRESARPVPAAPLGCTKLYRGQWLRVEIIHRGDVEKLHIECFYGYGPQWQAL